jgi:hypothetical protein
MTDAETGFGFACALILLAFLAAAFSAGWSCGDRYDIVDVSDTDDEPA